MARTWPRLRLVCVRLLVLRPKVSCRSRAVTQERNKRVFRRFLFFLVASLLFSVFRTKAHWFSHSFNVLSTQHIWLYRYSSGCTSSSYQYISLYSSSNQGNTSFLSSLFAAECAKRKQDSYLRYLSTQSIRSAMASLSKDLIHSNSKAYVPVYKHRVLMSIIGV